MKKGIVQELYKEQKAVLKGQYAQKVQLKHSVWKIEIVTTFPSKYM